MAPRTTYTESPMNKVSRTAEGAIVTKCPISEDELINFACNLLALRFRRTSQLGSPTDTKRYLALAMSNEKQEIFCCVFLDTRHRVMSLDRMFYGSIDGTSVHPREVVRRALDVNAAAVILAHNHPSGVAEPSAADEAITRTLKDALALVDVRVLDHIVVGGGTAVSFAERGLI